MHLRINVIAAVRIGVLSIAFAMLAAVFAQTRHADTDTMAGDPRSMSSPSFVCPMHRNVVSAAPGSCSICGMALVGEAPAPLSGGVATVPSSLRIPATTAARLRYDLSEVRAHRFGAEIWAAASIEDPTTVVALVYNDEAATLTDGEAGWYVPGAIPTAAIPVHFSAGPSRRWDDLTRRVRFVADGKAPALTSGGWGWVHVLARPRTSLAVPMDAVLQTTDGPCVLAVSDDLRTFTRVPVVAGRTMDEVMAVASGVALGTRILGRDVFFLDAERRVRGAERRAGGAPSPGAP